MARLTNLMKATRGRRTKGRCATPQKRAVGRLSSGLEAERPSLLDLSLEPCNHHDKTQKQGRSQSRAQMMQRITRLMSSPLLFHNRQFIMATASDSVDKPIERAIHGKVLCHVVNKITQPLIRLSPQLTTLLRPSSLTITNDSWQHRHHAAMREQDGGNGESRRFGVSRLDASLGLV
jgi:hypothetical protein